MAATEKVVSIALNHPASATTLLTKPMLMRVSSRLGDGAVGSTTLAVGVLAIDGEVPSEGDAVGSATLAVGIFGVGGDLDGGGSLIGREGDGGEGVH